MADIQKRTEKLDGPAPRRDRQRLHAGGAAESHRRIAHNAPTTARDFDCVPGIVAQVEINVTSAASYPDVHVAGRTVEMRPRLDHVQSSFERLWARRALGLVVVSLG